MSNISINCPNCQSTATRRIGLTSSGTQRHKCNSCGKSFTGTAVGRPWIGDRALTNYESIKRHRARKKNENISDEPDQPANN